MILGYLRRNAMNIVIPVAFGAALLLGWEWFVNWRDIKPYLLPTPSSIWHQGDRRFDNIRAAAQVSGENALVGLLLGVVAGSLGAMLANRYRVLSELLTPIAAAISSIPIVVAVVVLTKMFGATNQIPRRLMTMIIVFFVVFVNVERGLRQSDPTQVELMRSYAATGRQVMRKVRLPNALPFLFTAIKIAAPLAVTTAFVSEYFGGKQDGLGYKISTAIKGNTPALGWAYVAAACVLGLAFFAAANLLELVAVPWQRKRVTR
jgi:NitT/TauT family transport system permease protein